MTDFGELSGNFEFLNSNVVEINHSLNSTVQVQLIVDSAVRNDLIDKIALSLENPNNELTIYLKQACSGRIQIFSLAPIPSTALSTEERAELSSPLRGTYLWEAPYHNGHSWKTYTFSVSYLFAFAQYPQDIIISNVKYYDTSNLYISNIKKNYFQCKVSVLTNHMAWDTPYVEFDWKVEV